MIRSPLEQFSVNAILNLKAYFIDFSVTNGTISLTLFVFAIFTLSFLLSEDKGLVGKNWLFLWVQFYKLTLSIVLENNGKKGLVYFPFLLTIFSLILFLNLLGMVPYSFALTARMSFTFSISFSI
jgi:F-type H+-transporting ATPase subunit a